MNNPLFPPVSPSEIAYAASLFLAAADRQLHGHSGLSRTEESRCQKAYMGLVGSRSAPPIPRQDQSSPEVSLYSVFRRLWASYEAEYEQEFICSRVLAFHLLMERTYGDAIQGWTSPVDGTEEHLSLHPAVVAAIGSVRLCSVNGFCDKEFATGIRLHAMSN